MKVFNEDQIARLKELDNRLQEISHELIDISDELYAKAHEVSQSTNDPTEAQRLAEPYEDAAVELGQTADDVSETDWISIAERWED